MSFEIISWFYSSLAGEDKKFPSFIQDFFNNQNGICPKPILFEDQLWIFIKLSPDIYKCEIRNNAIVFRTINDIQNQCDFSREISPTKFITLRHGFSDEIKICLEGEEISFLDFDYSKTDLDYEEQWEAIHKAMNWEDLKNIVNRWILNHQIDPLRRIKHRAINLYLPLSTDIQFLLEIWRRKDFSKAKTHLEDLKADWCGEKSPIAVLFRLWYMLLGNHLNWEKGGLNVGLPKRPTDVSLPCEIKPNGEEKPLALYDWLAKYLREKQVQGLEQWKKLLEHVQIDPRENGEFSIKSGNGVYPFSSMITEIIKYPEKIKPNEFVNGLGHIKTFEEEFNSFLEWLNKLNDLLESLITRC